MHTLTAIYRAPENKEEFDKHYREVHTPLVEQMEGLRKMEIAWVEKMITPGNETLPSQPHLICTMYFDDAEALKNAMHSPGGQAAAKDLMEFAGPLVSMVRSKVETTLFSGGSTTNGTNS
jgi:uncharacterized protein (TIGR02118 family)